MILDDLANPFFAEFAGGVEEYASEIGYGLLLGSGGRQARRERSALATLLEYRVDGVILVSPRIPTAEIAVAAAEIPVVMVGRRVRGVDADVVVIDERHGVEIVVEHLVGLGHRAVTHVDGGTGAGAAQRRNAFLRAMQARRLGAAATIVPGEFTEEAGFRAARRMLEAPVLPTAVFAANDMVAAGVLGGFDQAGVDVPGEVSVVGWDNISVAHLGHISLTTVDQPRTKMGRMALELLLDRLEHHRDRVVRLVEPSLVVRSTTAPPRRA